jgi:RNA polymerase sigma-B factor
MKPLTGADSIQEYEVCNWLHAYQEQECLHSLQCLEQNYTFLIHRVIQALPEAAAAEQHRVLALGKHFFREACGAYDFNSNFAYFALSYLYQQLKGFLSASESQCCEKRQYQSFRLAEEDTKILQQLLRSLDERISVKPNPERHTLRQLDTIGLLKIYQQEPTTEIRNLIVQRNLGLVHREAHRLLGQCPNGFEDLVQVGSIGLIRAIERFDLERGHAFSSFAVPYIRGEIQHYLRDKSPVLRVPRSWLEVYGQAQRTTRHLRSTLGREPLDREIATALSLDLSEWQEIKMACRNRRPMSLDVPVQEGDDQGTALGELVTDHKYRSFQLSEEDSLRLQEALDLLEERTRQVVEFVFLKEFTHREVSEAMGISAVTVSRQLKKGVALLKQIMLTQID